MTSQKTRGYERRKDHLSLGPLWGQWVHLGTTVLDDHLEVEVFGCPDYHDLPDDLLRGGHCTYRHL